MSITLADILGWVVVLVTAAAAAWGLYMLASPPSARRCIERDIATIAAAHRDAWDAAFERRALTDRELAGLADAQAMLDCLERAP
jgi:hypothetical protein